MQAVPSALDTMQAVPKGTWRRLWGGMLSLMVLSGGLHVVSADSKNASTGASQDMEAMETWSQWYNTDNPSLDVGDVETPTVIRKRLGMRVCVGGEPVGAQCQTGGVTFTGQSPYDELTTPCSRFGVECYNEAQTLGLCSDYRIRFLCRPVEGLVEDEEYVTDSGQFFDARVYVMLALIPCCVFLARLLWSCCRKRHKRRLQERRESVVSSTDDESFSTAPPPPSYDELFEDPDDMGVFCISGPHRGPVYSCPSCERENCSVFAACNRRMSATRSRGDNQGRTGAMRRNSSTAQFRSRLEGGGQSGRLGRRASVIMRRIRSSGSFLASLPRPASCSQLDACGAKRDEDSVVLTIADDDEVFQARDSPGQGQARTHTSIAIGQATDCSSPGQAAFSSTSAARPTTVAPQPRAEPCTCSCHKACTNEGYVQDQPPAYSSARNSISSGFYLPRNTSSASLTRNTPTATLPRNTSSTSLPRNTSSTSLPNYEQALEILKQKCAS